MLWVKRFCWLIVELRACVEYWISRGYIYFVDNKGQRLLWPLITVLRGWTSERSCRALRTGRCFSVLPI